MNYLLHLDTSVDTGLVAVTCDGAVLAMTMNVETRNHAATINNMIADVLAEINISLNDLGGIVVCAGPGSYTGLRIGMATAKGLCYALDKPLLLDDRLTLLANKAQKEHGNEFTHYISLLIARDKEYFISIYNNDMVCTLAPQHIMQEQLDELIDKNVATYIVTDALQEVIDDLKHNNLVTDSDIKTDIISWAHYSYQKYIGHNFVNLSAAEPFYLKQVYTHK
jgi:tRNA threonylcarbamoyladenosine biosynthesis protein TsaB